MASQREKILRFVSWNTNGLKTKLVDVFNELNRIKADVAFIQETHIGPECCRELECSGWESFITVYKSEEKGVAILVRRETAKEKNFKYICHDEDHSGRYVVLFCHLYGKLFTLVNVYKNEDDKNILNELRDYLMLTAEGALIVGGDFNTVLHPSFDRKTSGKNPRHTTGRENLDDFTASLNLRDAWSYIHPTKEGYTWNGKESSSRIDMFFMPEELIGRVHTFDVETGTNKRGKNISDHQPLVLTLKVQQQTEPTYPCVASMLKEPFTNHSKRNVGKINGAEILRAIKFLRYSEKEKPFSLEVNFDKKHECGMSEFLKLSYNDILSDNKVQKNFKDSTLLEGRHVFGVDYLIFSQILANRLSLYINYSLKGEVPSVPKSISTLAIDRSLAKIRWSFLEKLIQELKKDNHLVPDCKILNIQLPKCKENVDDLRSLQMGCPLTDTILKLALNELNLVLTKTKCTTSICFDRLAVIIHNCPSKNYTDQMINTFIGESGINPIIENHA